MNNVGLTQLIALNRRQRELSDALQKLVAVLRGEGVRVAADVAQQRVRLGRRRLGAWGRQDQPMVEAVPGGENQLSRYRCRSQPEP